MNTLLELSRYFIMAGTTRGGHVRPVDRRYGIRGGQRRVGRVAIAATRTYIAIVHRLGVHTGGISLNGTNRMDAWRCRLPGAMTDPAGLSLTAGVHWGGWLARNRHGMYFAMTT